MQNPDPQAFQVLEDPPEEVERPMHLDDDDIVLDPSASDLPERWIKTHGFQPSTEAQGRRSSETKKTNNQDQSFQQDTMPQSPARNDESCHTCEVLVACSRPRIEMDLSMRAR